MAVTVEMKYYTCIDCGATYGYPKNYHGDNCPFCLKRDHDGLVNDFSKRGVYVSELHNTIRGLRGTITRMKNNIKREASR